MEIDSAWRLKVNEQTVGAKAMKTAQALSMILGGSSTSKKRLLTSAVHTQMLYAAPIWEPLLNHRANSNIPIKGDAAKHLEGSTVTDGIDDHQSILNRII